MFSDSQTIVIVDDERIGTLWIYCDRGSRDLYGLGISFARGNAVDDAIVITEVVDVAARDVVGADMLLDECRGCIKDFGIRPKERGSPQIKKQIARRGVPAGI